jgi:tRNA-Thr(GGU) m(6)t(6)A37 methyltransferase TsaA
MEMTMADNDIRDGEVAVDAPAPRDAGLVFIGRVRTPWTSRGETPRQGSLDGPVCRLEIFEPWTQALLGLDKSTRLQVVYWLHQSRRDLVLQRGHGIDGLRGTFALRSPLRPNPIGISTVALVGVEGSTVLVRGLDCLDETPLIDLKPERCNHSLTKTE